MRKTILLFLASLTCLFAQDYDVLIGIENLDTDAGTFDVRMANSVPVGGFQIVFGSGTTISGASGGTANGAGFLVNAFSNQILGFSLTGSVIDTTDAGFQDATLVNISYSGDAPVFNFTIGTGTTISGASGWALNAELYIQGLNGKWCAESDYDNCGICYFDSDHFLYDSGYDYEQDSACTGCLDTDAENFNECVYLDIDNGSETSLDCTIACEDCCASAADVLGCMDSATYYNSGATVDDGSCWTATVGCSCDYPEGAEVDCAGVCQGPATLDCAGTCSNEEGWIGDQGDNGVDECEVCGGSGKDDCGKCPGDDGLYGYTGLQVDLGGFNSTCTGCMDAEANNFNSTIGDPYQLDNQCSGDGCTIPCDDEDSDGQPDCCFYDISNQVQIDWNVKVVRDTTTLVDEVESPAVYIKIEDYTDLAPLGLDIIYRNWWFSDVDSLYGTTNVIEVENFYTDISPGDAVNIKLEVIDNVGNRYEKTAIVELMVMELSVVDFERPTAIWLSNNYPNPFNPSTTFEFSLNKSGHVDLSIYDIRGHKVATLINEYKTAGLTHIVHWDSNAYGGITKSTGIYFYELKSGGIVERKKMLLIT